MVYIYKNGGGKSKGGKYYYKAIVIGRDKTEGVGYGRTKKSATRRARKDLKSWR